jgi:hypothetical protein
MISAPGTYKLAATTTDPNSPPVHGSGNIVEMRAEGDVAPDCDVHATSIGAGSSATVLDVGRTIVHDIHTDWLKSAIWCQGMGNISVSAGTPPEELAVELSANVLPEPFDGLLAVVEQAIDAAPDEGMGAYWQAVCAALTQ